MQYIAAPRKVLEGLPFALKTWFYVTKLWFMSISCYFIAYFSRSHSHFASTPNPRSICHFCIGLLRFSRSSFHIPSIHCQYVPKLNFKISGLTLLSFSCNVYFSNFEFLSSLGYEARRAPKNHHSPAPLSSAGAVAGFG